MRKICKDVTLRDGHVYFGDNAVKDSGAYTEKGRFDDLNDIPMLYVIRVRENGYWRFVCGLDITNDGYLWLGGYWLVGGELSPSVPESFHRDWKSIKYILDNLHKDTVGKEWTVFEEEPLVDHREFGEE